MSELRTNRIIPRDGLPSGSYGGVIQVKQASVTENVDYDSTSDTTMLTLAFTPQRADSILWIHVEYPSIRSRVSGNTRNRLNHHIKRDGTEIYSVVETPQWYNANFNSSGVEITTNVTFSTFDSPNTTNEVTYTTTWASPQNTAWNTQSSTRRIVIFEMAT